MFVSSLGASVRRGHSEVENEEEGRVSILDKAGWEKHYG